MRPDYSKLFLPNGQRDRSQPWIPEEDFDRRAYTEAARRSFPSVDRRAAVERYMMTLFLPSGERDYRVPWIPAEEFDHDAYAEAARRVFPYPLVGLDGSIETPEEIEARMAGDDDDPDARS